MLRPPFGVAAVGVMQPYIGLYNIMHCQSVTKNCKHAFESVTAIVLSVPACKPINDSPVDIFLSQLVERDLLTHIAQSMA